MSPRAVAIRISVLLTLAAGLIGVSPLSAHAATSVDCATQDLHTAIDAASPGDTIEVSGDCLGNFWVNKDLTIRGAPSATLDGISSGTTLQVYGGATALIEDLTITGGVSHRIAGGVWVASGSTLTLLDSSVVGNWTWSTTNDMQLTSFAEGSGIFNAGTLALVNSMVGDNTVVATQGVKSNIALGGGIYNYGSLSIVNSTIRGNRAETTARQAGANASSQGGGIYSLGPMTADLSTIADNESSALSTGGLSIAEAGGMEVSQATITASIIARNTAQVGPDCSEPFESGGYNVIGDPSGCSFSPGVGDVSGVDAGLGSSADHGGPTHTIDISRSSPAIDRVPVTACNEASDQRGVARPSGGACDSGAYELREGVDDRTLSLQLTGSGSVTSDPPGITCTATCEGAFQTGTSVTLTATAGAGGGFLGWGGDCDGLTTECVLSMDGTHSVTAAFVAIPAPTISKVAPMKGGYTKAVTITGTHLENATSVTFGSTTATILTDTSTAITTTVPAGSTTGPIHVTTPGGSVASAKAFTVVIQTPLIKKVAPTKGGVGSIVTITGKGFLGATIVTFGGAPDTEFTVVSANTISIVVTFGSLTGFVTVTTPGGIATSPRVFTMR